MTDMKTVVAAIRGVHRKIDKHLEDSHVKKDDLASINTSISNLDSRIKALQDQIQTSRKEIIDELERFVTGIHNTGVSQRDVVVVNPAKEVVVVKPPSRPKPDNIWQTVFSSNVKIAGLIFAGLSFIASLIFGALQLLKP